jgi:hypothetical protein
MILCALTKWYFFIDNIYNLMNTPTDKVLYEKIKKSVFSKNPINSAYRSGAIVKEYKKQFKKKYGNKAPYSGTKVNEGLTRWFREDWRNQRGEKGYKKKGDIYRPTKTITSKTPKTFKQLTKAQITKAQKKKKAVGRVNKF